MVVSTGKARDNARSKRYCQISSDNASLERYRQKLYICKMHTLRMQKGCHGTLLVLSALRLPLLVTAKANRSNYANEGC